MPDFYNCFMYIYHIARPKPEILALFRPCSSGYYTMKAVGSNKKKLKSSLSGFPSLK